MKECCVSYSRTRKFYMLKVQKFSMLNYFFVEQPHLDFLCLKAFSEISSLPKLEHFSTKKLIHTIQKCFGQVN